MTNLIKQLQQCAATLSKDCYYLISVINSYDNIDWENWKEGQQIRSDLNNAKKLLDEISKSSVSSNQIPVNPLELRPINQTLIQEMKQSYKCILDNLTNAIERSITYYGSEFDGFDKTNFDMLIPFGIGVDVFLLKAESEFRKLFPRDDTNFLEVTNINDIMKLREYVIRIYRAAW